MELRTKKSWIKMQPKGRTPPIMIPGIGCNKITYTKYKN
jgi:hypothetical protein